MSLEEHQAIIYDLRTALVSILKIVNQSGNPVKQVAAVISIARGAARNLIDEYTRLKGERKS